MIDCKHVKCMWNGGPSVKKCSRRYIAVVLDTANDNAMACMCLSDMKRNWKKKEEALEALEGFVGNPCGYCGTPLTKLYDNIVCPKCESERFV